MKKVYVAPMLEIEEYELTTSIAANCALIVSNGPEMGPYQACDDFYDGKYNDQVIPGAPGSTGFWDMGAQGGCDCYTTAGGFYWTS